MRILKYLAAFLVVLLIFVGTWLAIAPPDLIRVASNYSAKMVCSNLHLAKRDPQEVLKVDVQAPGHPILRFIEVSVNENDVTASLLGLFAKGRAVHRPGFGCAVAPLDMVLPDLPKPDDFSLAAPDAIWPVGNRVEAGKNAKLEAVLDDATLQGPNMRAIVVVKDGRIIAERYGEGFDAQSPLLGWSMAKTVTAGIIGALEKQGKVSRDAKGLFKAWQKDGRNDISMASLLGMASSLEWNEGYGAVSDVTRMLFLEPDMAAFAADAPMVPEEGARLGKIFNYSSGTSVLISRAWQNLFNEPAEALRFPQKALFEPLGMTSAVMETDPTGTLIGSSYLYATGRDWARYGQFLLQKGFWNGEQLLPEGYVDWMVETHPADVENLEGRRENFKGAYARGHLWLLPPGYGRNGPDPEFKHKAWWFSGHDGQSVSILPEEKLVVVRLGLTPSKLGFKTAALTNAVVEALK